MGRLQWTQGASAETHDRGKDRRQISHRADVPLDQIGLQFCEVGFRREIGPGVGRQHAYRVSCDPSKISGTENVITWFPAAVPMMISL